MDLEQQVSAAIVAELKRQAEASAGGLSVSEEGEGALSLQGRVDLEQLAMALVGAVAGGP